MEAVMIINEGNHISVTQKVTEGKKDRLVNFKGKVIKVRGIGVNKMITVRQNLDGVDVDRIFPILAPSIVNVEILPESRKKEQKTSKRGKIKN